MKNLKSLGISTAVVALILTSANGLTDTAAQKKAAKDANAKNCPTCNIPPADNSGVAKLGKVINGLKDSSNCNGVLTSEAEISIAQDAATVAQQYLSGKITDAQRVAAMKALIKKHAGGDPDKMAAAAGLIATVSGSYAHNYAVAIALKKSFQKPPYTYTDQEKKVLSKFGLDEKDYDSFVNQQGKPYLPYVSKLAAIGAKFSVKGGWDFSNVQFNVKTLSTDKRLDDAIKWAGGKNGPALLKALSDPNRTEAVPVGDLMILPPQPQQDKSGKMVDGEVRAMSTTEYNKEVSDALDSWKSTLTEYLSSAKASSTVWNEIKQGWNSKGFDGWKNWLAWSHLSKSGSYQQGNTTESTEMKQAGATLSKDQAKLIEQLGVNHDLALSLLGISQQAHQSSAQDFANSEQSLEKTIKGLHWAPAVALAITIDPAAGWFALMPFGFGAGKAAVDGALDAWKFGGGIGGAACHFATDMGAQLGDDLLSARWAFAGGFGKAVGMVSPLMGALTETSTSAYFMWGMGKTTIQEGAQALDAHRRYVQYKAQGNDALANAALDQTFKATAGMAIDGAMVVTGTKKTIDESMTMAKESTPYKALTNVLATKARINEGSYRVNDVFVDPSGRTYKVVGVQHVKADADVSVIKDKTGKTVQQGEAVYRVRRTDAAAGSDAASNTFDVFQSDLEIPTRGKNGKTVLKPNSSSKAAKIRIDPDATVTVTDVANANAATPQQRDLATSGKSNSAAEKVESDMTFISQTLAAAKSKPNNGGAFEKIDATQVTHTQLNAAPEISSGGNDYFQLTDGTYFREQGNPGVYKITDPGVASWVNDSIAAAKDPAVHDALKLNDAIQTAVAGAKSQPVSEVPADAKSVATNGNVSLLRDTGGNIYLRSDGATGATMISAADAGTVAPLLAKLSETETPTNTAANDSTANNAAANDTTAKDASANDTSDVSKKLFKNGKLKTGWFSSLVEASKADQVSLAAQLHEPDLTLNGVDFFRSKSSMNDDFRSGGSNENVYARDAEGKIYRVKDADVATKLGKMMDVSNVDDGNLAQTETQLAQATKENDKTPSKKQLAGQLWDRFVKFKKKTDQSFTDKTDAAIKSIKESAAARKVSETGAKIAKATGYDMVQAAARDHLIIEQAVSELDPVEASKIADQLEKDPKAQEEVEKIAVECGMGAGAATAVMRDDDFLDSLGVLYSDNEDVENSCTL